MRSFQIVAAVLVAGSAFIISARAGTEATKYPPMLVVDATAKVVGRIGPHFQSQANGSKLTPMVYININGVVAGLPLQSAGNSSTLMAYFSNSEVFFEGAGCTGAALILSVEGAWGARPAVVVPQNGRNMLYVAESTEVQSIGSYNSVFEPTAGGCTDRTSSHSNVFRAGTVVDVTTKWVLPFSVR